MLLLDSRDDPGRTPSACATACFGTLGSPVGSRTGPSSRGLRYFLDVAFRALRLVIEIDGRLHEADPDLFENDRWRQNALVLHGWMVLRFTYGCSGTPGRRAAQDRCSNRRAAPLGCRRPPWWRRATPRAGALSSGKKTGAASGADRGGGLRVALEDGDVGEVGVGGGGLPREDAAGLDRGQRLPDGGVLVAGVRVPRVEQDDVAAVVGQVLVADRGEVVLGLALGLDELRPELLEVLQVRALRWQADVGVVRSKLCAATFTSPAPDRLLAASSRRRRSRSWPRPRPTGRPRARPPGR